MTYDYYFCNITYIIISIISIIISSIISIISSSISSIISISISRRSRSRHGRGRRSSSSNIYYYYYLLLFEIALPKGVFYNGSNTLLLFL